MRLYNQPRTAYVALFASCILVLAVISSNARNVRSTILPGKSHLNGSPASRESLNDELKRRQKQDGLTLVSLLWSKVYSVDFSNQSLNLTPAVLKNLSFRSGSVSPDGTQAAFDSCGTGAGRQQEPDSDGNCVGRTNLGTAKLDGSDLRKIPEIVSPAGICWSPDASQLALSGGPASGLEIVDAFTGKSQSIEEDQAFFEPQCWSSDGNLVVYTRNEPMKQTVVTYNLTTKRKTEIAKGGYANWIPRTDTVTFKDCGADLQRCTYYAIRPDGSDAKALFKTLGATTPLSWSSDGRLAAYISYGQPTEPKSVVWRLRVWRRDDKSEVWVSNLSETDTVFFQWIADPQFAVRK